MYIQVQVLNVSAYVAGEGTVYYKFVTVIVTSVCLKCFLVEGFLKYLDTIRSHLHPRSIVVSVFQVSAYSRRPEFSTCIWAVTSKVLVWPSVAGVILYQSAIDVSC